MYNWSLKFEVFVYFTGAIEKRSKVITGSSMGVNKESEGLFLKIFCWVLYLQLFLLKKGVYI